MLIAGRGKPGSAVDRRRVFAQSVCGVVVGVVSEPMKKAFLIVVAVVLAPILFVGVVAFAAGDWRTIGATAAGDQVSVSTVSTRRSGARSAWVRVQYKDPAKLPQVGPFVELRARVRFNCGTGGSATGVSVNSEWFYSKDRGGQLVVSKKLRRDDQFGQAAEGGFGTMARDYVCGAK